MAYTCPRNACQIFEFKVIMVESGIWPRVGRGTSDTGIFTRVLLSSLQNHHDPMAYQDEFGDEFGQKAA